jgi:hypothetical protein
MRRAALISGTVSAMSAFLLTSCGQSGPVPLETFGDASTCQTATSAANWAARHHESFVLALNTFIVHSRRPVVLVSATAIKPTDGLRVVNVAFVPSGHYGAGPLWGQPTGLYPAEWRDRQEFPGGMLRA